MAQSIVNQLGERMEAKLEHDLSSVCLNGPDRDSQLRRNLFVRFPLGQETHDFELAWSCSGPCPFPLLMLAPWLQKSLQHNFGYFVGEETLALRNDFHSLREALREIGFQKVSTGPDLQCPAYHVV